MQGISRHQVIQAVSSREAFAAIDARKESDLAEAAASAVEETFIASQLIAEGKRGLFENTGTGRRGLYLSDGNHVVEIEPASAPTSIIVWAWAKDGHTGCTFVQLHDFEAACLKGLTYVAEQRARLDAAASE